MSIFQPALSNLFLTRFLNQACSRRAPRSAGVGLRMEKVQDTRTFNGEMTDAGRRELKDLEGQWKKICECFVR